MQQPLDRRRVNAAAHAPDWVALRAKMHRGAAEPKERAQRGRGPSVLWVPSHASANQAPTKRGRWVIHSKAQAKRIKTAPKNAQRGNVASAGNSTPAYAILVQHAR